MAIFIEITVGANEGTRHKVRNGLTIGRSNANIAIQDPKVSGVHAQFEMDEGGHLVLVDLNSSNGVRVNGHRVKKVMLIPGVTFELGRTQFKVVEAEEEVTEEISLPVTWRSKVRGQLEPAVDVIKTKPAKVQAFSPALKLVFTQGIQADQEIILGYGPRQAGSGSLDIELLDEAAPQKAFEIRPGAGVAELKVLSAGRVTLNNKTMDAEVLKDGDIISVGKSLIKVTYL